VHPLHGPELSALRQLQGTSPYVFTTEAGTPVTTSWFLRMVQRTGRAGKLPFPVHRHVLRHATGFKLANDGHDTRSLAHYLGHRNLQSTARYTALVPDRFARFWQDWARLWRISARRCAREDLDSTDDWVRNLRHVPFGGQTHDRYNVDFAIAFHSDRYDDGGCWNRPTSSEQALSS